MLLRAALLAVVLAGPAVGQEPAATDTTAPHFASPFLPAGHWSVRALRKLDGLGLLPPGYDPGLRTPTRREAGWLFRWAARVAARDAPPYAHLVAGYLARFTEEFAPTMRALDGVVWGVGGSLSAGYDGRVGDLKPGTGDQPDTWLAPTPLPDVSTMSGAGSLALTATPYVALAASGGRREGSENLDEAYAVVGWRSLGLWLGRRAPGYGTPPGGAVVLNGAVPFTGVGLFLADPVRLPGFLRGFGRIQVETFVSELDRHSGVPKPWFWAMRAAWLPHPRLSIGLNRAAIFNSANGGPPTLKNLAEVILIDHPSGGSAFENQVASFDLRYRPPLGLPLTLYVEWGFEDTAGAWLNEPGIVAGAELAALPGLPAVTLGIERASFAHSCCNNPIWYRHMLYTDGWTENGQILGYPLGGNGSEWQLRTHTDLLGARVQIGANVYARWRGAQNLFEPQWQGRSTGVALSVAYRPGPALELFADGEREVGQGGWTFSDVRLGARMMLR